MIYWYIAAFVHYAIYGMINEEAQFTIRMIECSNIWAAATAVYSKVYTLWIWIIAHSLHYYAILSVCHSFGPSNLNKFIVC